MRLLWSFITVVIITIIGFTLVASDISGWAKLLIVLVVIAFDIGIIIQAFKS